MSEDRMSWWQGLIGLRGAAGETTTRESSQVGVETKVKIQALGFAVLALIAVPGTLIGGWLAFTGFLALVDVKLTGTDALFVLALVGLFATGISSLGPRLESASDRVRLLVWGMLTVLAAVFAAVVFARLGRGLEFWPTVSLLVGLGLLYGGPLLAYNMSVLLRDPYAWQSPFERRYLDLYERERFPEPTEPQTQVIELRTEKGEFVTSSESLGLSREQLVEFAQKLIGANWDLREEVWGKTSPFPSYPAYRRVRNRLEAQGLVYKLNPGDSKSTYGVTRGGAAAFRRLAEE